MGRGAGYLEKEKSRLVYDPGVKQTFAVNYHCIGKLMVSTGSRYLHSGVLCRRLVAK